MTRRRGATRYHHAMTQTPPTAPGSVAAGPTGPNGLGIAGFVVSLVGLLFGFFTCGLVPLVGTVLSAVGLRKEPRGLAIAGLVLGVIGLITTPLLGIGLMVPALNKAHQHAEQVKAASQTAQVGRDVLAATQRQGKLPASAAQAVSDTALLTDPWGGTIILRPTGTGDGFHVVSPGKDGIIDTPDDIVWGHPEDDIIAGPYLDNGAQ